MDPLPTWYPRNATTDTSKTKQLRAYTQRLRAALPSPAAAGAAAAAHGDEAQVDAAWGVYTEMQTAALELARAVGLRADGGGVVEEEMAGRLGRLCLLDGAEEVDLLGAALGGLGISDGDDDDDKDAIDAVREWAGVVRRLREALRIQLGVRRTSRACEEQERDGGDGATTALERMGGLSMAARYKVLGRALGEMKRLVRTREGVVVIAARGDAVLEFNGAVDDDDDDDDDGDDDGDSATTMPVLRFRVSSAMLAQTSPFFARLFAATPPSTPPPLPLHDDTRLYRVPAPRETNAHGALTILLCAAHMRHDRVPRAVRFEQLVAVAEACLRYECTAPVEVFVEHLWLPAWIHKALERDGVDGLVVVSYVFGLRRLFARVSKTAVLGVVDGEELAAKGWPAGVKDRIWAVRNAKMAQVYTACSSAVQEYLRPSPPPPPAAERMTAAAHSSFSSETPTAAFSPTGTPRCPKGSQACDAANLGWLLLVLNERQLLHTVMKPSMLTPSGSQPTQQPRRSLAQLLDVLRCVPSPVSPVQHAGVCDPALALRAAVNDVYNSVEGLTLFEVDGKRHGWALSRHKVREAQSVLTIPLGVLGWEGGEAESTLPPPPPRRLDAVVEDVLGVEEEEGGEGGSTEGSTHIDGETAAHALPLAFQPDEATCLRIMSFLHASDDLYAAAMTSRTFYAVFKRHELFLIRRLVKSNRRLTLSVLAGREESFAMERTRAPTTEDSESGRVMDHEPWLAGADALVMTEEEACRILWPEEVSAVQGGRVDALNDGWEHVSEDDDGKTQLGGSKEEKVLLSPGEAVEEKSLVVLGDKSLREQLDRRKGIAND